ncbi:hypothetical protein NDU88_001206 [Pleurodeles waltl]|uniref:Uncharacterized protein n=1 Tax=Pleurodeles waltl TaxID=8319 RepID=A0AAV7L946_PLEWA|nr:hypothetical protein NDU88_001206 [Pleurodeles waltl]
MAKTEQRGTFYHLTSCRQLTISRTEEKTAVGQSNVGDSGVPETNKQTGSTSIQDPTDPTKAWVGPRATVGGESKAASEDKTFTRLPTKDSQGAEFGQTDPTSCEVEDLTYGQNIDIFSLLEVCKAGLHLTVQDKKDEDKTRVRGGSRGLSEPLRTGYVVLGHQKAYLLKGSRRVQQPCFLNEHEAQQ